MKDTVAATITIHRPRRDDPQRPQDDCRVDARPSARTRQSEDGAEADRHREVYVPILREGEVTAPADAPRWTADFTAADVAEEASLMRSFGLSDGNSPPLAVMDRKQGDRVYAMLRHLAALLAAAPSGGARLEVEKCQDGQVQVSFVGVDPNLRSGPYRWNPSQSAFLELIVDGRNFRIDIGNIKEYTPDGHMARGMHINFPCPAKVIETAINAVLIELEPTPTPQPKGETR